MGNEMFQARIPDDFAERIHEYREENHMSKSEAVRHLLRRGLDAEQDDTDNEDGQGDRLQVLAQLGEKVAFIGVLLAVLSLALPLAASLTISIFGLTVGQFGAYLIIGLALLLAAIATILVVVSWLGLIAILTLHGIEVGFFGHHLAKVVPTPDQVASA